ncbi:MAG: type I restriction-modification system subunit M [Bacteroidales bacterium]|jgi:type I restriction enzyme M protein|nr:type I restriction-modification system subunit M [Bacteroidales bacterium]
MSRELQRAELHRTIWKIANDLRGSVDGWDFKQYVLGFLFYRFISENITNYLNNLVHLAGNTDFNFAKITDEMAENARQETVTEKGFYILPSELFENVRIKAKTDQNLNETLERVFKHIEGSAMGFDSENDLKGLFDDVDVNSNKLGGTVIKRNELLVKLLDAIGDLNLGNFQDNSIDAFGDAYEFLMTMYASNAGKSGGEFFTPQEVSELLTKLTLVVSTPLNNHATSDTERSRSVNYKQQVNKVYDPACGSGSLLLKFAKVLGKENVRQGFYGQEINITTYNLCRINMFLHDINFEKFDIAHGDTLIEPHHWDDEPFEAIVSNPPYSTKWAGDENPLLINDPRFSPAGVLAPKSKADLAFTMHMLSWLATDGTAAIVEFPGVLYRGGAEQKIRKYLIDNNYVDCVIQLPANLFFGVSIATCIIVLKKSKIDNATLFIDASKESVKSGNKEKLSDENIEKILNAYINRHCEGGTPEAIYKGQQWIASPAARNDAYKHFARLVPNAEIAANDYNIAVSSYVEQEDTREVIDIKKLNAKIAEIVKREDELRKAIDEIVNDLEGEDSIKN